MHAIEVNATGGPEVLRYVDKPRPSPSRGEVLIKRRSDRRELRRHLFPVWAVSAGTSCSSSPYIRSRRATPCCCTPGAGGVSLILTQWATSLGARVITTVSTAEQAELSRRAGAVDVLSYPDDPQKFGEKIRALTGGDGVAAAFDGVGKSTFDVSLASLAIRGTLKRYSVPPGTCPPFRSPTAQCRWFGLSDPAVTTHFMRTREEFIWHTGELFKAIAAGAIEITVSRHYP